MTSDRTDARRDAVSAWRQAQPFTHPVMGPARALHWLLIASIVGNAAAVWALLHQLAVHHRHDGDLVGGATSPAILNADSSADCANILVLGLFVAIAAVFLIWLYRCCRNVAAYPSSRYQRHAPGWALGGWVCPVANLGFPYQIVTDIWLDTEQAPRRHGIAVVRVWWALWLASCSLDLLSVREHALADQIRLDVAGRITEAAAAAALLVVVARITRGQQRREDEPVSA